VIGRVNARMKLSVWPVTTLACWWVSWQLPCREGQGRDRPDRAGAYLIIVRKRSAVWGERLTQSSL